jgi:uncharacterized protein YcbK (DUF882 family)
MTYVEFCVAIAQLAALARFRVTSWWRSPVSNAKVGGVEDSWHILGMACDVVAETVLDTERIKKFGQKLGLKVHDEVTHLHLEPMGAVE